MRSEHMYVRVSTVGIGRFWGLSSVSGKSLDLKLAPLLRVHVPVASVTRLRGSRICICFAMPRAQQPLLNKDKSASACPSPRVSHVAPASTTTSTKLRELLLHMPACKNQCRLASEALRSWQMAPAKSSMISQDQLEHCIDQLGGWP